MSGPAPFGMRWTNGTLVPELSERDAVCELVEAFVASGGRIKATASALNSKGFTTRRGTSWSDTAVGRVVRNPALADLVHEALWDRFRPLLDERAGNGGSRRRRRPVHPLGGVVHCRCGGRMRPRGHGPAGKYTCGRCRAKIPVDTLEKLFKESLAAVELDASEIVAALGTNPRAAEITRMLGGRSVPLSEIWPELDPSHRRQLVERLVAQLVVGTDDISVVFSENDDSKPKIESLASNSLPTSHGSEVTETDATSSNRPPSLDDLPDLLSVDEVAQVLRISRSKVYELVASRELQAYKPGGRLRVQKKAVREFLRDSRLSRNAVR